MIKKIFSTITLFFIMIVNVEAATSNLKLECSKEEIEAGTTTNCNVILEVTEGTIEGYQFNIKSSLLDKQGIATAKTFSLPIAFTAIAITTAESLPPLFPITIPFAFDFSTYSF